MVSFVIPLIPGPQADFNIYPAIATIDDPVFRFENWSIGLIDYWLWDFGDDKSSDEVNPHHTYNDIGTFDVKLIVTNKSGCIDSITKTAIVIDRITLFVPNCFTPNGDGVNDLFIISGQNISDFELFIYSRWGELMYKSKSLYDHWDGKYKKLIVPEGIYNWLINYSEDWGGLFTTSQFRKGIVTVIR